MTEPYKAVPTAEQQYGVVRVDTGVVVADGFDFLALAECHAIRMNDAAREAANPKTCGGCGAIFTGGGRLCGGHHSKAQIRDAYGATSDNDI